jgi:hypothetical protein
MSVAQPVIINPTEHLPIITALAGLNLTKAQAHSTVLESVGEQLLKPCLPKAHPAELHLSPQMFERTVVSEHISDLKANQVAKVADHETHQVAVCSLADFHVKLELKNFVHCSPNTVI